MMTNKPKTVQDHSVLSRYWSLKNKRLATDIYLYARDSFLWECPECSFEFLSSPAYQCRVNGSCPRCLRKEKNKEKHLGITHPEFASTLLDEKNEGWKAEHLTASSNRKLWWRCLNCQSEYEAKVSERIKTKKCAYCSGKRVSALNSLATLNPELAKEWHPAKNGDIQPSQVTVNSNRFFWWQCENGHEWRSSCKTRNIQKSDCPICTKEQKKSTRLLSTKDLNKSLKVKSPLVASHWHPMKNGDLTPEQVSLLSKQVVWWQCPNCRYEWEDSIINRTRTIKGRACPCCKEAFKNEK